MGKLLLTVEEAADHLSVGRTIVYDLIRAGAIESVKIGRLRRIPAEALQAYVNGLHRDNSQEVVTQARNEHLPPERTQEHRQRRELEGGE